MITALHLSLGALLLILVALGVAFSGTYNIAASKEHSPITRWLFSTVMEKSVKRHASGREKSEIGKGLNPEPPALSHAVEEFSEAELFWILKHGIKMSGMSAFGKTHSDEDLWAIVAFLQKLPDMSPEEINTLFPKKREQHP